VRKLPKEIQEQVYVPERDGMIEDFELRRDDPAPPMEPTEVDIEI
jgi:hypothetical protein